MHGSFNLCIPIFIQSSGQKVLVRCSHAHELAESYYPGNVDEKANYEVATYASMQEPCSEIRLRTYMVLVLRTAVT